MFTVKMYKNTHRLRKFSERPGWVQLIKKEAKKVFQGCKLLCHDSKYILFKKYKSIFYTENFTIKDQKALDRTKGDLFKMIPFSVFIIIPGMELLLPLFLYVFPNMIPSTFLSKTKQEAYVECIIHKRPSNADKLHRFLLEKAKTLEEQPDLIQKIRNQPQKVTLGDLVKSQHLFKKQFTLGSMDSDQLRAVCRFLCCEPWTGFRSFNKLVVWPTHKLLGCLGINFPAEWEPKVFPLSSIHRNILMLQARSVLRKLREGDSLLLQENLDTIEDSLLDTLCWERGIPTEFQTDKQKRKGLKTWVFYSTHPLPGGPVQNEVLVFAQVFQYLHDSIMPEEETKIPLTPKVTLEESIDRILNFETKEITQVLRELEELEATTEISPEKRQKITEKLKVAIDQKLFFEERERIKTQLKKLEEIPSEQQKSEGPNHPNK